MKNTSNLSNKKGFTLIELLVVIAIIGILSGIGLVSLNGAREKARDAARVSDLAQYRTALLLYFDSNNSTFPDTASNDVTQFGDCIHSSGLSAIMTTPIPPYFSGTGSLLGIFVPNGSLTPAYLGSSPKPLAAAILGASYYCYDTNEGGAPARDEFLLFTRLETLASPGWYYLDETGAVTKPATDRTSAAGNSFCSTGATCVW